MSQVLDRIRQAARHRTKEKFTALFHHINPEALRTAFYALKREAAPGVDGMTWRTYEAVTRSSCFLFAIFFFVVIIVEYGLDPQRFASTYPLGTSLTDTLSPAA